jgi:hypothetical protein
MCYRPFPMWPGGILTHTLRHFLVISIKPFGINTYKIPQIYVSTRSVSIHNPFKMNTCRTHLTHSPLTPAEATLTKFRGEEPLLFLAPQHAAGCVKKTRALPTRISVFTSPIHMKFGSPSHQSQTTTHHSPLPISFIRNVYRNMGEGAIHC